MSSESLRFINSGLLESNCAGDPAMMRDIITMGLQSVSKSITDAGIYLESEDCDKLARVLHKLRPSLCYCGINNLTDELMVLEKNIRDNNNLPALRERIMAMLDTLQQVHTEMEQKLSSLSG